MDSFPYSRVARNFKSIKSDILKRGDLKHVTVQQQLFYLEKLNKIPLLGQELISKGYIDSSLMDLLLSNDKRLLELVDSFELADFLVNKSPFILSCKRNLNLYTSIIKKKLHDNIQIASIPCGLVKEILQVNFSSLSKFKVYAIDYDKDILQQAKLLVRKAGVERHFTFLKRNAWELNINDKFEVIISCGLNIYVDERVSLLALFFQFYKALQKRGTLIISYLTFPPWKGGKEWKLENFETRDLLLERVLFEDILDVKWMHYVHSNEMKSLLKQAGFTKVYNPKKDLGVFPIIVAQK